MNIGNITSDNMNLTENGRFMQIELYEKEIERLKEDNEYLNKVNIELSTEKNRLNNKLELISKIVEREFPPNEFITYKIKKILKGDDKE